MKFIFPAVCLVAMFALFASADKMASLNADVKRLNADLAAAHTEILLLSGKAQGRAVVCESIVTAPSSQPKRTGFWTLRPDQFPGGKHPTDAAIFQPVNPPQGGGAK